MGWDGVEWGGVVWGWDGVGLKRACHLVSHGTCFALRLLASGIHPETRKPFRWAAIPEHEWQSKSDLAQWILAAPGRYEARTGSAAPLSSAQARLQAVRDRVRQRSLGGDALACGFPFFSSLNLARCTCEG